MYRFNFNDLLVNKKKAQPVECNGVGLSSRKFNIPADKKLAGTLYYCLKRWTCPLLKSSTEIPTTKPTQTIRKDNESKTRKMKELQDKKI